LKVDKVDELDTGAHADADAAAGEPSENKFVFVFKNENAGTWTSSGPDKTNEFENEFETGSTTLLGSKQMEGGQIP
jgi:hypothetical protein